MEDQNSIKELFTSAGPFDEKEVVGTLKPLISINENNYNIFFLNEDMKVDDKVLAFALAKKLLSLKGHKKESSFSATEVCESTDMAKGSIDFSFKSLRENKYLIGKGKDYEINKSKISQIIERLKKLSKVDSK